MGSWFAAYAHPRVRAMLFLGFSAGLTFPLVLTTLSARLRQAGIDRTTIGYFSLVGLAYSLKFFWAPAVDRLRLPFLHRLGRRRSWMLVAQCGIMVGLVAMALHDPAADAVLMAWLATLTVFVNDPEHVTTAYLRYLENSLRQAFPLEGTPIRLHLRARSRRSREPRPASA